MLSPLDAARHLVGYLDDDRLIRHPPVHDLAAHRDLRIGPGDVAAVPGVAFTPGSGPWLSVDPSDRPPAPALPDDLAGWVTAAVSPRRPPVVRHPDPVARRLIELTEPGGPSRGADGPSRVPGEATPDLDTLDAAGLAALGLAGVAPGGVAAAAAAARAENDAARARLEAWTRSAWDPWAPRRQAVERGRTLYRRLFELRNRIETGRERVECLWGFGRLRWPARSGAGPTVAVDHPLVCVPVEIDLDPRSGRLSVTPSGPPSVETGWAAGLPLADRDRFEALAAAAGGAPLDPWGIGAATLVRALLRAVDPDGVAVHVDRPGPSGGRAVVALGEWELFARPRTGDRRAFLDACARALAAPGALVAAPFAALVDDRTGPDGAGPASGGQGDGGPDAGGADVGPPALFPLPASAGQRRSVTEPPGAAAVTVVAPPGTGATQTIANLVVHYLAEGKRVLVTATREETLAGLADRLPRELRPLCASLLGAPGDTPARLAASLTAIADATYRRPEPGTVAALETELEGLVAEAAVTAEILKRRRAAETELAPHPPPECRPDEWTPAVAARWLADHADLAELPDVIAPGTPVPLTDAELAEVGRLCSELDATEADAALLLLPEPADLPPGAELAAARAEAVDLTALMAGVEGQVADWSRVDAAGAELTELSGLLEEWAQWRARTAGTWLGRVVDEAASPGGFARWQDLTAAAETEVRAIAAATARLGGSTVTIVALGVDGAPSEDFAAGIADARNRLATGRPVGVLQRAARRALDTATVDGVAPVTLEHVELVHAELTRRTGRHRLAALWADAVGVLGAPGVDPDGPVEEAVAERIVELRTALTWASNIWPALAGRLAAAGVALPVGSDDADLARLASLCRTLCGRHRLLAIHREFAGIEEWLADGASAPDTSPVWERLAAAFAAADDAGWDGARREVVGLLALRPSAGRRRDLLTRLAVAAPRFAARLAAGEPVVPASRFAEAWRWRQLEGWIRTLDEAPQPTDLQARLEEIDRERRRVATGLAEARAWSALAGRLDPDARTALHRFTEAIVTGRSGAGPADAEVTVAAERAIPVWIMALHRVYSSVTPGPVPPFDVVIVDRAGDCGLPDVAVLTLGRRAVLFGEDGPGDPGAPGPARQVSFDLLDGRLPGLRSRRDRFDPDHSLFDIARRCFPEVASLTEQYTTDPAILALADRERHAGPLVALADRRPHPRWAPLGVVTVRGGIRRRSDDTNPAEASAVVDLVDELTADPLTAGMTVGVMVLRPGVHSQLVAGLLLERLGPTLFDERQVLVGGPDRFAARGRDILVVSCVVDADDGTAGFASVTGRAVTLAACRATRQLWVVHSVPAEALGRGDARRALIEHCRTPVADPVLAADRIRSPFQRALRRALAEAGYTRVLADYRVGGHVVDLVVEGPVARLGVVCDGDRWDGPEEWDRQRHGQAVLERCGWTFERVRASAFARDPDRAVAGVVARLVALGVPTGDWTGAPCLVPTQRQWPRDFHPSGGDRADGNGPLPDEAETAPADPITLTDPADPTGRADPPGRADLTEADVRDRPAAPAEDLLIFEIRDWARRNDLPVGDRGRLSPAVIEAWNRVHPHRLIER